MQAARFDLGQVQQQRSEELIRLADEAPRVLEQLLIIEVGEAVHASRNELGNEVVVGCHVSRYTRDFGALALRPAVLSTRPMTSKSSGARSRFSAPRGPSTTHH